MQPHLELEHAANAPGIDGRCTTGNLTGNTVNVKQKGQDDAMLDMNRSRILDYYLVVAGPCGAPVSSRGKIRPICIDAV